MPYIQRHAPLRQEDLSIDSIGPVVMAIGTSQFPEKLFASLTRLMPVDHCAAFQIFQVAHPAKRIFSASRTDADFAMRASHRYADEYWLHDPCLKTRDTGSLAILHQCWNAIPHSAFREECYVAPQVVDRLSILMGLSDGDRILLSMFRHRKTGFFSEWETDSLRKMARVLVACVVKHASFAGAVQTPAKTCLSNREQAVADLLIAGLTVDSVARSLSLSPSTIETYRKRLYAKLDVRSRVALASRIREISQAQATDPCHPAKF
ncbi:helix-turn-helix transcriptional regulator [Roseiarcaceae bacterium H3SJ34-1]|uniref:helix-turn-helix transcriptional regulator n=1 Tax=Terripilifer ovatus TaxID=3032367 RepID=UPI003AB9B71E|nr:helix-turn-helix transcriptional regulator [Roseiarcaceae bacterium H3SJ34-1]